ncbi:MAG TPA: hypothetical protein VK970_22770 [Candidatus Methylacidiphilales bacterium]|nr:hypothetical protein [Candidatus Methylacidiphilales bacterium]
MRSFYLCLPVAMLIVALLTAAGTEAAPPETGGNAPATAPGSGAPGAPQQQKFDYNAMVLAAVRKMPSGGGYSARQPGFNALKGSIAVAPGPVPSLDLRPETAQPSFCSGATYHVFLEVLQQLIAAGRLNLSEAELSALEVRQQPDGTGIWGRWNANGPGTARLFYELGLGKNFSAWKEARAGDFMKIWWTREIGAKEAGHSVIFLGLRAGPPGPDGSDGTMVRFWSSNLKMGYGEKEVEFYKVQRVLFSRLENPAAIRGLSRLPKSDDFLASLLKVSVTEAQVYTVTGVTDPPTVAPRMPPKIDASPDVKSAVKTTGPMPSSTASSTTPAAPKRASAVPAKAKPATRSSASTTTTSGKPPAKPTKALVPE